MLIYLEKRGRSGKTGGYYEVELDGTQVRTRSGSFGYAEKTDTKTYASPEKAREIAESRVANKRKEGYSEVDQVYLENAKQQKFYELTRIGSTLFQRMGKIEPPVIGKYAGRMSVTQCDTPNAAADDAAERLAKKRKQGFGGSAFPQLEALLAEAPSEQGWERICAALSELDDSRVAAATAQSVTQLGAWESASRPIDVRWLPGSQCKPPFNPRMAICNTLEIDSDHYFAELLTRVAKVAPLVAVALPGCDLGYQQARSLSKNPLMERLERLDLTNNDLGDRGAEVLVSEAGFPKLSELRLALNGLGDAGARALATSPALASLRVLELHTNQIGVEGATALLESATMKSLAVLGLSSNAISATEFERLRAAAGAVELRLD
jgi:predicted DNA-binding WGR domain protein